jgi:predicted acylesterase/phospholipase RssA
MGRTLPTSTILFQQEEAAFSRFRRALRRSDQLALDDLFTSARQHLAAAQYAAHALPFEVFLLSMLLEEHKEVMKLREGHAALRQQVASMSAARQNLQQPGLAEASESPPLSNSSGSIDPGFGFDDDPDY